MDIRIIETAQDYEMALNRVWSLMDAKAGTPEVAELEMLVELIETYEGRHFPTDLPASAGSGIS